VKNLSCGYHLQIRIDSTWSAGGIVSWRGTVVLSWGGANHYLCIMGVQPVCSPPTRLILPSMVQAVSKDLMTEEEQHEVDVGERNVGRSRVDGKVFRTNCATFLHEKPMRQIPQPGGLPIAVRMTCACFRKRLFCYSWFQRLRHDSPTTQQCFHGDARP
jgi:hypothetical protein